MMMMLITIYLHLEIKIGLLSKLCEQLLADRAVHVLRVQQQPVHVEDHVRHLHIEVGIELVKEVFLNMLL